MAVSTFTGAGGAAAGGTDSGWTVLAAASINGSGTISVDITSGQTYWIDIQGAAADTVSISGVNADSTPDPLSSVVLDAAGKSGFSLAATASFSKLFFSGVTGGFVTIAQFDTAATPASLKFSGHEGYGHLVWDQHYTEYPNYTAMNGRVKENDTFVMFNRSQANLGTNSWIMGYDKTDGTYRQRQYAYTGTTGDYDYGYTMYGDFSLSNTSMLAQSGTNNNTIRRWVYNSDEKIFGWDTNSGTITISGMASTGMISFGFDPALGANGRHYAFSNTDNELFYSDDDGLTWSQGATGLTNTYNILDVENGTVFMRATANTANVIKYSTDNGASFSDWSMPSSGLWFKPVYNSVGGFWTTTSVNNMNAYTADTLGGTWTGHSIASATGTYCAQPQVTNGKTVVMVTGHTTGVKAAYATSSTSFTQINHTNQYNYESTLNNANYGNAVTFKDRNGDIVGISSYSEYPPHIFHVDDNDVYFAAPKYNGPAYAYYGASDPTGQFICVRSGDNRDCLSADYGRTWRIIYFSGQSFQSVAWYPKEQAFYINLWASNSDVRYQWNGTSYIGSSRSTNWYYSYDFIANEKYLFSSGYNSSHRGGYYDGNTFTEYSGSNSYFQHPAFDPQDPEKVYAVWLANSSYGAYVTVASNDGAFTQLGQISGGGAWSSTYYSYGPRIVNGKCYFHGMNSNNIYRAEMSPDGFILQTNFYTYPYTGDYEFISVLGTYYMFASANTTGDTRIDLVDADGNLVSRITRQRSFGAEDSENQGLSEFGPYVTAFKTNQSVGSLDIGATDYYDLNWQTYSIFQLLATTFKVL